MLTNYHCVHCKNEFAQERSEDEHESPRCPQCMRKNGVEVVGHAQPAAPPKPRNGKKLLAALLLLGLVGVGGYFAMGPPRLEETIPDRTLTQKELAAYLVREGVVSERWADLFDLSAAPAGDAEKLTAEAKSPAVNWLQDVPLDRDAMNAQEVADAFAADGSRKFYSLELAIWLTGALRAQGQDARVVEVWGFAEDATPADRTGDVGYYGVALSKDATHVFDPMRGTQREVDPRSTRTLRDTEVVAAAMGLNALRTLTGGDGAATMAMLKKPLELDPKSPTLRTVHAMAMLDLGAMEDAVKEYQAAHSLRPDAPRKVGLSRLYLAHAGFLDANGQRDVAMQQRATAGTLINQALEQSPDYARGLVVMAGLQMGVGEMGRAKVGLDRAQEVEPDCAAIPSALAQYHLQQDNGAEAARVIARGVQLQPNDWQTRFHAAQIFGAVGDAKNAREHAIAAVSLVATAKRERLRAALSQALGAGVFDEPSEDDVAGEGTGDSAGDSDAVEADDDPLAGGLPSPGDVLKGMGQGSEGGGLQLGGPGGKRRLRLE